jgi:LuxR family maltose regulon positive regulatory protein
VSLSFKTQTAPPRGPRHLIRRPRLIESLVQALDRRLIAVVAPAGAGKTSLLADFARTVDRPLCWLTVDEWLADPAELLGALASALDAALPGTAERVAQASSAAASEEARLRRVLIALVDALAGHPSGVIVLDDAHRIADSATVAVTLDALLDHLPFGWTLVLAGRRLPDLACNTRLLLDGDLLRLSAEQLALTPDEAASLLSAIRGGDVPAELAEALWRASGGWAAALVLRSQADLDSAAAQTALPAVVEMRPGVELFDYLARSVLGGLRQSERNLLLRAAIPRTLDSASLGVVLRYRPDGPLPVESDAVPAHPAALARRHAFIVREVREDCNVERYRFHDLFRDFLLVEGRTAAPEFVAALHDQLADLCRFEGQEPEAQYHLREAADWPALAESARQTVARLRSQGRWRALSQFVDGLPSAVTALEPELLLQRAEADCHLGRPEHTLTALAELAPALAAAERALLRARASVLRGTALRFCGSLETAIGECREGERQLLALDAPGSLRAHAQRELGLAHATAGNYEEALTALRQALQVFEALGETGERSSTHDSIAVTLLQLGRPAEAATHLERARQGWSALQNESALAITLNNLGVAYATLGDEGLADDVLVEAQRQAEAAENLRATIAAMLSRADLCRDRGDGDGLAALAGAALARARALGEPYYMQYATQSLAEAHRLLGDLDRAEVLVREALGSAIEQAGQLERGLATLTLGQILCDRGDMIAGVEQLRQGAELLERCGAAAELVRAWALYAIALQRSGSGDEALHVLRQASKAAHAAGLEAVVLRFAGRAPDLFRAAGERVPHEVGGRTAGSGQAVTTNQMAGDPGGHAAFPRVTAHAFGRLRVLMDGAEVRDDQWESDKARELLFFLLAHPGIVPAVELSTALWPDMDLDGGRRALHSTVYRLRRALYPECVVTKRGGYQLNPAGSFWFDAAEFRSLTAAPRSVQDDEYRQEVERAVTLYTGPFAATLFGEWAEELRRSCEERYLQALAELSAYFLERRQPKRALEIAGRALEQDRLFEPVVRTAFEAELLRGDMAAALQRFRRYRDAVGAAGLRPSPDFARRAGVVLSGRHEPAAV